jgi:hypothetical protein
MSEYARTRPRGEDGAFMSNQKIYDWLLGFESVRSWIDAYTAQMTSRNCLLAMNVLCKRLNLNPDQILELGRANGDKVPHDLKTQFTNLTNTYVQSGKLGEAKKIQAALR